MTEPRTAGELRARVDDAWKPFRESVGVPAFADADEFNERLVASHRLVVAEALLDELDTTFQAVRGELVLLTDEQLHANDGRVIRVVEGNTYGHYAEHAAELGIR